MVLFAPMSNYCSKKLVLGNFPTQTMKLFTALQVYLPEQEFPRIVSHIATGGLSCQS